MPQYGEINKEFGIFRNRCCGAEIVLGSGIPFPDCPEHSSKLPTEWELIESGTKTSLTEAAAASPKE
jgi:hypothetical protein